MSDAGARHLAESEKWLAYRREMRSISGDAEQPEPGVAGAPIGRPEVLAPATAPLWQCARMDAPTAAYIAARIAME